MNRSVGAPEWRLTSGKLMAGKVRAGGGRMVLAAWAVVFALSLLQLSGAARAETRWRLDPEHTTVMFEAPHIGFARLFGLFLRVDGEFDFDEEERAITYLRVKVHLDSVFTNDSRRDRKLRSADFLDADDHPVAEFIMTDADPSSRTTGQIIGDLRMRGVTMPVTLDVTLNRIGTYPDEDVYVLGASATTVIKRSDFGNTYATAEGWIPDEIPVRIEVEAIREEQGR